MPETLRCNAAILTVHNSLLPNIPIPLRDKYSVFENSKVTIPKTYGNNKGILRFRAHLPDDTIALYYFISTTKFMKDHMYIKLFGQTFQILPEIKHVPDGFETSFLLKDGETLTLMTISKDADTVLGIQKTIAGPVYLYELPFNNVIGFEYFPRNGFKNVVRKDDATRVDAAKGGSSLIPIQALKSNYVYCYSSGKELCFLGVPNEVNGNLYSFSSICKDEDLITPYFDINNLSLLFYPIENLPQIDYCTEIYLEKKLNNIE
jgi:hypothetical protein